MKGVVVRAVGIERGECPRDAEGSARLIPIASKAWPLVPLRDLCIPRTGVRNPGDRPDDTFRYVDISAVDNDRKRITAPQTLLGRDAPSRARNVLRARDVVVSTTRPNLNAVALVPEDLDDQICSTGFCVLRAGPRIVPEYLFAFVRSPAFVAPLTELVKGALYPAVNDGQVLALEITLPPLEEQERIAGRLMEQLAAVERARAAAQSRLAAAKALPAAYLREVFEGPEANGWEIVEVRDFAEVCGGLQKQPKRSAHSFHRPYLTVRNVQRGLLDLSHIERFEITPGELERLRLEAGDILIVEGNGSPDQIGRNAVFELDGEEWIHQNHIIRVRLSERADHQFVSRYLNSDAGRGQMLERARSTSGLYTLSVDKVNSLEVPLPPLPDQYRIAADLSQRIAAAERLIEILKSEITAIEALPAALLRDAFFRPE